MAQQTFEALFSPPLSPFHPLFAQTHRAAFRPLMERAPEPVVEEPAPEPEPEPQPDPEAEALARAEGMLDEARDQAAQIIAAAEQNAQLLVQQAVRQARAEQTAAFQQAAAELLEAIDLRTGDYLQQLELQTASLVTGIVQRVLNLRFEDDPQTIVPVVRQALQELTESSRVQVVVAPEHGEAVRAAYAELAAVLPEQARLDLVITEKAAPLGCVAHGDHGSVDARLERRLQAIEEVVQDAIDEARVA